MLGLRIPFGVDSTAYRAGLASMRNQTKSWAGDISSMLAGAISVGTITSLSKAAIDYGSSISDAAYRTRTTTREFQILRDVARDAGADMGILEKAITSMNIRTQEAVQGNEVYKDSFVSLGINLQEFAALGTADRFEMLAKAMALAGDESRAFNDMAELLGVKGGPKLLEVLQRIGEEGFEKLGESAAIMKDETVKNLDEAGDAIEKFKDILTIKVGEILGLYLKMRAGSEFFKDPDLKDAYHNTKAALTDIEEQRGIKISEKDKQVISALNTDPRVRKELMSKYGITGQDLAAAERPYSEPGRKAKEDEIRTKDKERAEAAERQRQMQKEVDIKNAQKELDEEAAKHADDRASDEERLARLLERRATLEAKSAENTVEGLGAKKEMVSIDSEIYKVQNNIEDKKKKEIENEESLKRKLAEADRQNVLNQMSDQDRLTALKEDQKKLLEEADIADKGGNTKGALEKRIEAESVEGEIFNLEQEIKREADRKSREKKKKSNDGETPTISVASVQEVGGGGGAFSAAIDPMLSESRRQTELLRRLVQQGESGGTPTQKEQPKPKF